MSFATIAPRELYNRLQAGRPVTLIDVRTPAEFREVHAEIARNVPLDRLRASDFVALRTGSNEPVYVICRSGSRGKQACEKLQQDGLPEIVNVEGGTQAWEVEGLPVVRGQKAISLERQVRIGAGSLVLIGVLLGWFAHPLFFGLAAFVGAGLVFAGVTDTCGMGLLLARMPWNRVSNCAGSSFQK